MTVPQQRDPGAVWLSLAHRSPDTVWTEWAAATYAILPAGRLWDVVTVPLPTLTSAMQRDRASWARVPILRDLGTERGYVWVPSGTAATWPQGQRGTRALGSPWWVAVPHPSGPQVPERRWLRAPDAAPALMSPTALRAVLGITKTPPRPRRGWSA